jgi:hypothetical protein
MTQEQLDELNKMNRESGAMCTLGRCRVSVLDVVSQKKCIHCRAYPVTEFIHENCKNRYQRIGLCQECQNEFWSTTIAYVNEGIVNIEDKEIDEIDKYAYHFLAFLSNTQVSTNEIVSVWQSETDKWLKSHIDHSRPDYSLSGLRGGISIIYDSSNKNGGLYDDSNDRIILNIYYSITNKGNIITSYSPDVVSDTLVHEFTHHKEQQAAERDNAPDKFVNKSRPRNSGEYYRHKWEAQAFAFEYFNWVKRIIKDVPRSTIAGYMRQYGLTDYPSHDLLNLKTNDYPAYKQIMKYAYMIAISHIDLDQRKEKSSGT